MLGSSTESLPNPESWWNGIRQIEVRGVPEQEEDQRSKLETM